MTDPVSLHDGRALLYRGDNRETLRLLPDNSIDSIVTDPPYALVSIVKRFGKEGSAPPKGNDAYQRASAGFMGKSWDTGEVAFSETFWAECLRVLKPGGHVVAFSGTRTYHRMTVAVEDAGFEIRDQLAWVYGSGFPKSHNLNGDWQGWGTALKPAWEPICLARKPLVGTVAANVLTHGTGALNIDRCRVAATPEDVAIQRARTGGEMNAGIGNEVYQGGWKRQPAGNDLGRWPANLIHDGSEEVLACFPDAPGQMARAAEGSDKRKDQNVYGSMTRGSNGAEPRADDTKSAARFFYCAKASKRDRDDGLEGMRDVRASQITGRAEGSAGLVMEGGKANPYAGTSGEPRKNTHPTVKPTALMQWLCRLITPPSGVVLDPFMGSGSTGKAALLEGFQFIGCEREGEYMAIAEARIAAALRQKKQPANDNSPVGDLFGEAA